MSEKEKSLAVEKHNKAVKIESQIYIKSRSKIKTAKCL